MTLPVNRYAALLDTRLFLVELAHTSSQPREVRDRAASLLKHYPSEREVRALADASPDVLRSKL